MKILSKIITLIIITLMIFTLTSTTQINTFASLNINTDYRKIANVAVLLYSFDDLYIMEFKQSLEDIQNENKDKVRFTFYDGKNNVTAQNETLDSLLKSDIDLFILNLADTKESIVEDVILKIKQKNIPVIFMEIAPEVASKLSKYYDKAAFIGSTPTQQGILQGEIIVDLWNNNRSVIDKNSDNILQYVLLEGKASNPIAIERTNDVISVINSSGIKTEELSLIHADWSKELAKESINNLFLKYNERIEAIIANNDAMAIGAIEALQKYGYNSGDRSKYISVVGIDGLKEAINLIDKGLMTGTVITDQKIFADAVYNIGMNLINNKNPIENTDYKLNNRLIIFPVPIQKYTSKSDNP